MLCLVLESQKCTQTNPCRFLNVIYTHCRKIKGCKGIKTNTKTELWHWGENSWRFSQKSSKIHREKKNINRSLGKGRTEPTDLVWFYWIISRKINSLKAEFHLSPLSVNCTIIQTPRSTSPLQSCGCHPLAQGWIYLRTEQLDAQEASGMWQFFQSALYKAEECPAVNALWASGQSRAGCSQAQEKQEKLFWTL